MEIQPDPAARATAGRDCSGPRPPMRVVFCGTGEIGLPALRWLVGSDAHEVVGVITQPDRPAGRDLKPRPSAIKVEALERGIPVAQPEKIRRDPSALLAWLPDVMVVAAYGQILPPAVLEIPRMGCLNLHASLLPRHRGASPIQSAILAGDLETGMTVMYMDEGLDTGDVLLEHRLTIGADETAGELHDRLASLGAGALEEALGLLGAGAAPRHPQDPSLVTYAPKLEKHDGRLDWREPSDTLVRRIRAMTPWPGATARWDDGSVLKIHSAASGPMPGNPGAVLAATAEGLAVGTGNGCLVIREMQAAGRRRMSAAEFLRGCPIAPGRKFDLSFSVPS